MAKRKKKSRGLLYYFGMMLYGLGLGTIYFFKGIFAVFKFGAKTSYKAAKKSSEKRAAVREEKARPKIYAKFAGFKELRQVSGDINAWQEKVINAESTIGIILGARGTGKSAIGMKVLENVHAKTGKNVYAMGFNAKDVPSWIHCVDAVNQIENDSYVLIDEGGITFSSRRSMSDANQLLSSLLLIARHKNISVLFITQNSSNLEVNVLRQADFLIMKPSSLLQIDFERKKIKDIYASVSKDLDELKSHRGLTYIHADSYQGFITNDLPSFWSSKVSKAFKEK